MAIVFMDSFDLYSTAADFNNRLWYPLIGGPTVETTTVKDGRACLKLDSTNNIKRDFLPVLTGSNTHYVGFWFRFSYSPTTSHTIIYFNNQTASGNMSWRMNSDRTISLVNALSSVQATSSLTLTQNTWHFIEIKFKFADSISANDVIFYVDGTEFINLAAGTDTAFSGTNIVGFNLSGSGAVGSNHFFDSLVLWDTSGSGDWTGYMDPFRMALIKPNGNGNSSQFTGSDGNSTDNYLLMDEATSDGDTTYVESTGTSQTDLYAFENLPDGANTIFGVNSVAIWRKTTADTKNARQVTRISSTNYEGSSEQPITDYTWSERLMVTSPATSSAWTKSEVDGAEFGIKDHS